MAGEPGDRRGIEREKQVAAEAAAELVEDGMTVGLGTGSTVAFLLPALARRSLDIVCAATSPRTEHAARELGLRIENVASIDRFDITIDGADQIAPDGWLVKGGGGAHTREKIVAAAADRFVVIADSTKPVRALHSPIPLELLSFGLRATMRPRRRCTKLMMLVRIRYQIAATKKSSKVRKVAALMFCIVPKSSCTPMTLNSDVPLIMDVNSLPSGGMTTRAAWGRTIQRMAVR